ncbi:hypothetical protein GUJ93_ZPchr0001g30457 [Zizania palustris]|uniref:Tunicamycin induced 1 n=1 Tax=Zizania palustris TaxID=103762 RepID=A0A8J5RZS1_ZIZPA|nr:hypothetical protein GUJ93_ZPchr0001g30457 [Zizania palustris]
MAARARWGFLALPLALLLAVGSAAEPKPPVPKAISDLREAIVKGLGFQSEELEVSGFDVRDALVGQAVVYEFDIEVGRKVVPVRLLEGVNRWDFVDLPIFRSQADADNTALAEIGRGKGGKGAIDPTLPPFQLAGPMELWIQKGDDVRLALPHDVEAGTLKKVVLSDGAVVTVKGAKAVNLRLPLELPLPLNRTTYKGRLSSLLSIAQALRGAARSNQKPLLSLRIEGPTSLSSTPSMSPNDKLKLKRLAPGQVELSSRAIPAVTDNGDESHSTGLWPLLSLNGSDGSLQGFEELLASVLGKKAGEKGTFKLLKARASAQTYVKMGFEVEKRIADREVNWSNFPEWKTKPTKLRAHYEVLARVEDGQAIPERIAQVQPFEADEATSESVLTGNVSMSKMEVVHPPPVYFTL